MAYNFQAIDYSQGLQNRRDFWDTINKGVQSFGRGLSDFGEHYDKWDEMLRKKDVFNSGLKDIRNKLADDQNKINQRDIVKGQMQDNDIQRASLVQQKQDLQKQQAEKQADSWSDNGYQPLEYRKGMSKGVIKNIQSEIGADADGIWGTKSQKALDEYNANKKKTFDKKIADYMLPEGAVREADGSITYNGTNYSTEGLSNGSYDDTFKTYSDSINDLGTQINDLDTQYEGYQDQYDELNQLSEFAKYMSDPRFEAALKQSELDENFEPLKEFINKFNDEAWREKEFEYRKEQDALNLALRKRQLMHDLGAKDQADLDMRLSWRLNGELSKLEGLNFNRAGKVASGPLAGNTMEDLIEMIIGEYEGIMSDEELYGTIMKRNTTDSYWTRLFDVNSRRPRPGLYNAEDGKPIPVPRPNPYDMKTTSTRKGDRKTLQEILAGL